MAWHSATLGLLLAAAATTPAQAIDPATLHVPSPDWRDQVIYFVVTDRFADGDRGNDDQGAGEFDPADGSRYSGGDLAGLTARLDYIRGLGATAVWITPPVANQWLNPARTYAGYHGYWAEDFSRVDAHLGTLADYQGLSRALHARGMYLVQDIVLNHTGDYFHYRAPWRADAPAQGFVPTPSPPGHDAPGPYPFTLNDAREPKQRAAGVYHWTPDITDYNDPRQLLDWQLAGLDDINTENPRVRAAFRDLYGDWIRRAGVDAFRVDTVFYVPPALFRDFLYGTDPKHPGVMRAAAATGRRDFFAFGEGFGIDRAYDDTQSRRVASYMRDPQGRALLPGMLDFPLYGALGDVFARGRPTAELADRLRRRARDYPDPHRMVTFVDNHDVDRFLAGGSEAGLRQALLAILTLPGIPAITYGTEQGFREQRGAMFAGGFGSGGQDHFDTQAPLYRFLREAIALRRQHPVFSRGDVEVLFGSATGPGGLAYRVTAGDQTALVAFNTADHPVLLDHLRVATSSGSRLTGLYGFDGVPSPLATDGEGEVSLSLPARSAGVWSLSPGQGADVAGPVALSLDAPDDGPKSGDFEVGGRATGVDDARLVVDGDLATAVPVVAGADGRWTARVDTRAMIDPAVTHAMVLWSPGTGAVSLRREFRVARAWTPLVSVDDPAGDDRGPDGRYTYPDDAVWRAQHPGDLRKVEISGSGGAISLRLTMPAVCRTWNPPNGFDHVAFTVYFGLPGRSDGARVLPLQNAELPQGLRWHYRLRVHGWSNALFSSRGASATEEGTPVTPAADIRVDRATGSIELRLPAAALGNLDDLSGVRVYVTTWDYDGGYRPLQAEAGPAQFGGGVADAPKVLDDTPVITLP